jgi:mandelate racemase
MALSGVDMAAWDALARAASVPLVRLLGGAPKPVRAYLGNGFGVLPVAEIGGEGPRLAAEGFGAIKVRLGRPSLAEDVAALRAARRSLPDEVRLMADFNQSLTVREAIVRGRALDDEGLSWIEEPVRADDFPGCAQVTAAVRTPIQLGENFSGPLELHAAASAGAGDLLMADVQQLGGVTGWLRAAAVAHAFGRELSSHLFQEVSAHLLAVSPTADWLEYMPLADPVLREPLAPARGMVTAPERPGTGVEWDEDAVRRYAVA